MSSTVTGGASEEEARASARKNVARAQQVFPRSLDRKEDKIDKRLSKDPRPFVYNHFEILRGLCTKTGLIRSLK